MRFPTFDREYIVRLFWLALDGFTVIAAVYGSAWLRYDLRWRLVGGEPLLVFALVAALIFVVLRVAIGAFWGARPRGSFEELAFLVQVSVLQLIALAALYIGFLSGTSHHVPRSLPLAAPVFALLGMFATRFAIRTYRWGRWPAKGETKPAIVYGAGSGGRHIIKALKSDYGIEHRGLTPVAFVDDDENRRRTRIEGVRWRGTGAALRRVAEETGAKVVILAIPSLSPERLRQINQQVRDLDLELLILPPIANLLGPPRGADLRQINLEDLLGRQSVSLDTASILKTISRKRVLVTGAGGSIGSELCRQIKKFGPAQLIMLDRDESALHTVQLALTGRALFEDDTVALCDIRDADALVEVFEHFRPEVVFHAAALKHLSLLERFPLEAWKTNVLGTSNVLRAAQHVGVDVFVNVSTDKAADPVCVLGYGKRVAERLTADVAAHDSGTYVSVRFGNVLGSRGSVIPAFTAQIEKGGPVTVTHPDVERYFMLIPEACQLVLQAAAMGSDGKVMVLDMGRPVKILDVANTLIELSGRTDVEIEFTGLRVGEKLGEVLFSEAESSRRSVHPMVSEVEVPLLSVAELSRAGVDSDEAALAVMKAAGTRGAIELVAPPLEGTSA